MKYRKNLIIETDRLYLRPLCSSDCHELFDLFADERVLENFVALKAKDRQHFSLDSLISHAAAEQRYLLAIVLKANQEVIGLLIQNNCYDFYHNTVDLGYALKYAYWHQGLMSEALKALISYFFKAGVHRICGECFSDNRASARVMEKCGMKLEGKRIEEIFYPNRYRDSDCYYILNKTEKH